MNNSSNPKMIGIELLRKMQILYQNGAITTEEKNQMAFCIKEGMTERTFYKLNRILFDVLERTSLPHVVEEMIEITI